jgi:hypothetical protein
MTTPSKAQPKKAPVVAKKSTAKQTGKSTIQQSPLTASTALIASAAKEPPTRLPRTPFKTTDALPPTYKELSLSPILEDLRELKL